MVANEHADSVAAPRKTIFVRNLPFDTSSKQLEEAFSEVGPIKKAFVVKDKDNASKCRGFGYVYFVLQDDADKAVNTPKLLQDRKLKLSYANKKPKHEKRKLLQAAQIKEEIIENEETTTKSIDIGNSLVPKEELSVDMVHQNIKSEDQSLNQNNSSVTKINDSVKTDLQRTIVLTGLTSKVKRKAFRALCETFGVIENIVYPVPERSEVTAFVRYKDYKSTIRAVQKIPGLKVKKSNTLSAILLTKEGKFPTKKALESSRLIIRNLDFKCTEDMLRELFLKFGKISDIHIPSKKVKNRTIKIGCAFVQYENKHSAKSAIDNMNLKKINGREVVIDWAISKEKYNETESFTKGQKEEVKKENLSDGDEEELSGDEESGEDVDEIAEDSESDVEGSESDVGGSESDVETTESETEIEHEKKKKKQLKDAKEGKTVFVRNLSYNTEEDDLTEEFEKFGEVEYCKIVRDSGTGRSKGSAFVKFQEKSSADTCVEAIEKLEKDGSQLRIDGRPVSVSLAVTRGKLTEIMREKTESKADTDKRNLYLAYEGVITKNSPGFETLLESDLKKREKALAEKKAKLKNPNYFVSKTRLCIRNLPLTTDANELKKVLEKHGPNGMIINEVKIMRNKERKDASGVSRSLGFGFVNVGSHEHALTLLRGTNNNPDVFGDKRRPIVEFSVENNKALQLQQVWNERNEQKLTQFQKNADVGKTVDNKLDENVVRDARRKTWWDKRVSKYHKSRARKKAGKKEEEMSMGRSAMASTAQTKAVKVDSKIRTPDNSNKNNVVEKTSQQPRAKTGFVSSKNFNKRKRDSIDEDSRKGVSKRSRKKKQEENNLKEEKFNKLVSQYKTKLLSNETSLAKEKKTAGRWFSE